MTANHAFHFALYERAEAEVLLSMAGGLWLQIGPFMKPGLLGQVHDLTATTRVIPFNDLEALETALAPGDVAAVLAEPVMTNCGMRTLFKVVVPLALPGIASGVLITFIPALGAYLTPDLLGGPDSQMIANVIERQFKRANDWPFGAALSFLLMYLTFVAIAVQALVSKGKKGAAA